MYVVLSVDSIIEPVATLQDYLVVVVVAVVVRIDFLDRKSDFDHCTKKSSIAIPKPVAMKITRECKKFQHDDYYYYWCHDLHHHHVCWREETWLEKSIDGYS